MIRAVVRGKMIEPLDPLPAEWAEGLEVFVEASPASDGSIDPDPTWLADMDRLTADLWTREEWEEMKRDLSDADEIAKAHVRRQMGLD